MRRSAAWAALAATAASLIAAAALHAQHGQVAAGTGQPAANTTSFLLVLGDPGCPHCRRMLSLLAGAGVPTWFCPVRSRDCAMVFYALYRAGITRGYPTTIVCINGEPAAIVVGVVEPGFFSRLLQTNPVQGTVAVYDGEAMRGTVRLPVPGLCRLPAGAERIG